MCIIISRSPFRCSLIGGGTDYPAWYKEHNGAVLATSINKYCYITARYLPPFFDHKYRIRYTQREETQSIEEISHPSVRECLRFLNVDQGVEIQHNSDLPAGIGVGSSSSFTVGLLHVLYALQGKMITKRQLALNAIHVEQDRIKENIGSQDQISAAFGGFNRIDFDSDHVFQVKPVTLPVKKLYSLERHLMLFFTGFTRVASEIAGEQIRRIPERKKELLRLYEMVDEAVDILNGSDVADFGRLLHESWMIKRGLTNRITTLDVDRIYETALKAGALGGKLIGAGGGGCMLFFVEPENQPRVKEALKSLCLIPFRFEDLGSQIVYYSPSE